MEVRFSMARYRRVLARPQVADRRQLPGNAEVNVEPASSTTNDAPELTASDVAPEASPAQTKSTGTRKGTRRKPTSKAKS